MNPALAIMAKVPGHGEVKTRLGPALSSEARRELYEAFLLDRVEQARHLGGTRVVVAYTPAEASQAMRELLGNEVDLVAQRGSDLGGRLASVAGELLGEGHPAVLLVDSDTPSLPPTILAEAIRVLADGAGPDLVLGPAWDGGYYAIGLRRPIPELFETIAWSTRSVLSETVRRARALGLRVHFLPGWFDVDTPADLDRLARELETTPRGRPGFPWRTAEVMSRLRPAVLPAPRDESWRTLSSRSIYQNPWMRLDESVVDVGGGTLTLYGVVTCKECAGVVPVREDGAILLIRQFRYVARRFTWEIPTGAVEAGESAAQAAHRELREESGYAAASLEHLSTFHTSKSILDEVAHIYLGRGLTSSPVEADVTEQIETMAVPPARALRMVESHEILDAMSVVGIFAAARRLGW